MEIGWNDIARRQLQTERHLEKCLEHSGLACTRCVCVDTSVIDSRHLICTNMLVGCRTSTCLHQCEELIGPAGEKSKRGTTSKGDVIGVWERKDRDGQQAEVIEHPGHILMSLWHWRKE